MRTPLNRLVIACVGSATLAAAVGAAWRDGHGAGQASSLATPALVLGLEIDLAAGAAALAVGLCLAARLRRRSDAAMAAVAQALADLATAPDPRRLKPLETEGDLAWLAQGYNAVLAGFVRRERNATFHTTAQIEKVRLAELSMLRQDMAAPLATVESFARGLARESLAPEDRRRDRRIAEALGRVGDSILATLDDITHRTSASPNGLQTAIGWLDLCEVIEDVGTLLWTKAAAKGLDLAVYVDPKISRLIQGDAVRLRQIVGGLVNSALAATPDGGVLIEVEPDSPDSIRISIHDTGPALTPGGPLSGVGDVQAEERPGDRDGTLAIRMGIYRQMVKAMAAAPSLRRRGATEARHSPSAFQPRRPMRPCPGPAQRRPEPPLTA